MDKVTEDLRTLVYFWEEKGDITRIYNYEKVLANIESKYPEIALACRNHILSEKTLDRLIKSVKEEVEW